MTHTDPHASSLLRGRVLAFAAILLAALNLRTAVTSVTPLLDRSEERRVGKECPV